MPNFQSNDANATVFAENDGGGPGLYGYAKGIGEGAVKFGYGVIALMNGDPNIYPVGMHGGALIGLSDVREGLVGVSSAASGVLGVSSSTDAAVTGQRAPFTATTGIGVNGIGGAVGVQGIGNEAGLKGVSAFNSNGVGVWGESTTSNGVLGLSHHNVSAAVSAVNDGGGTALFAETKNGAGPAGHFVGDVQVDGSISVEAEITLMNRGDICENFLSDGTDQSPAGTVMVASDDGSSSACATAYDRRAVGIVSGAGELQPGITLGAKRGAQSTVRIAMVGTVYCRVDADLGPVTVGDLLTTSPTTGHAMKAADSARFAGAVIGKAIGARQSGQGLIPVIVMMR